MTLTLDFPAPVHLPKDILDHDKLEIIHAPEDGNPWNYIFCSSQLPEFCRLLLEKDVEVLHQTVLFVEIDFSSPTGQAIETGSTPGGLSRVDELLNPLRQLHSIGLVDIHGPLSDRYKNELSASICKNCPDPEAIIQLNMVSLDRADEQVSKGHFTEANQLYKSALSSIRSCKWPRWDEIYIMDDGPFPGLTSFETVSNLVVRLQARIASVYLQTGQLRMARIYTERALDPRRAYDRRHNKQNYIEIEEWEGAVYAEVLHVAANISYANNDVGKALYDLRQAIECGPFDEEQENQRDIWRSQLSERRAKNEKREEQREMAKLIQSRKEDQKIEGIIAPKTLSRAA